MLLLAAAQGWDFAPPAPLQPGVSLSPPRRVATEDSAAAGATSAVVRMLYLTRDTRGKGETPPVCQALLWHRRVSSPQDSPPHRARPPRTASQRGLVLLA